MASLANLIRSITHIRAIDTIFTDDNERSRVLHGAMGCNPYVAGALPEIVYDG